MANLPETNISPENRPKRKRSSPNHQFSGDMLVSGASQESNTRWWHLKYFLNFHPDLFGEMIQFDEHIFQMGWFNHQLANL